MGKLDGLENLLSYYDLPEFWKERIASARQDLETMTSLTSRLKLLEAENQVLKSDGELLNKLIDAWDRGESAECICGDCGGTDIRRVNGRPFRGDDCH
ncbi:MAG: hypothetical protein JWN94_3259 [Betaproteobacteria bacterium]|nr:hypothetical protein [Betaproteobacteria bacterium]